jgi:hypothetical protein
MKKIKTQKPVSHDISFEYKCHKCSMTHWVFLREVRVKNFKIICQCGKIIRPKRIKEIQILYYQGKRNSQNKTQTPCENTPFPPVPKLPIDILEQCVKILESYGYSKSISKDMILKSFNQTLNKDIKKLISHSLKTFGGKYV